MKIAVTYDNGNVFQHFGKTENFKVYEVEDKKVVSSTDLRWYWRRCTDCTCGGRYSVMLRCTGKYR